MARDRIPFPWLSFLAFAGAVVVRTGRSTSGRSPGAARYVKFSLQRWMLYETIPSDATLAYEMKRGL